MLGLDFRIQTVGEAGHEIPSANCVFPIFNTHFQHSLTSQSFTCKIDLMDKLDAKLGEAACTKISIILSQEEIRRAILLLATDDVKRRFSIGSVIQQQGVVSLPELARALDLDPHEIRRTVVYIIGGIGAALKKAGQSLPAEVPDTLYRGLLDEDPKVRCNSAVALGRLNVAESVGNITHALNLETSPWVRPSMVLALGAIGGPEVAAYLASYQPDGASERIALMKALDHSAGVRSNWRFIKGLADAIPVELWTIGGLERVLAEDAKEKLSLAMEQVAECRMQTSTADAYSLFALRTFAELLVPLTRAQLNAQYNVDEVRDIVAEMIRHEHLLERILSLHEGGQQIMRYRLEIRGRGLRHPTRRAIIQEVTDLIAEANSAFVNSPSHYSVEIRMLLEENKAECLLKPFTIPDDRFGYRVRDVPAAINPVVAAGIMRLAPRLFAHGRVLDPFCGSGTVLIERGFAGSYDRLVGVDISRTAVEAAQQNVRTAGFANIDITRDDVRNISRMRPFDEIITNMPFGIRTSTHETNVSLYRDFFDLIPHILAEHGLVMIYTQEIQLTERLFRTSRHIRLSGIHRVVSGGLRPAIFVGVRK